jgi:hypothetical protein
MDRGSNESAAALQPLKTGRGQVDGTIRTNNGTEKIDQITLILEEYLDR